jgi:hypothetical protein
MVMFGNIAVQPDRTHFLLIAEMFVVASTARMVGTLVALPDTKCGR